MDREQNSGGAADPWRPLASGYPRQELTEQQVTPGRSRRPWLIAAGVVLLIVVAGVVGWVALGTDGESTRDAYCDALTAATDEGDLMGVLGRADEGTVAAFEEVAELAPDAVADDWDTLFALAEDPAAASDDPLGTGLGAFSAVQSIARDAEDECGLSLEIPLG